MSLVSYPDNFVASLLPMPSSHNLLDNQSRRDYRGTLVVCTYILLPLDNLSRRDYRSVEKNDAINLRMPSGMCPVCGCIPTACKACKPAIFLPSEPFLTECYYCPLSVCLIIHFHKLLPITSFINYSLSACLKKAFLHRTFAMTVGRYRHCEARSNPEMQNIKELKKTFIAISIKIFLK